MSHRIPPSMDEADGLLPLEVARWFAIRSKGGQERKAHQGFTEQGLMAYLPFETRWHRNRFGKTAVSRPLFVSYLFVCCDDAGMRRVLETDGVNGFVCYISEIGEVRPMPIPPRIILGVQVEEARGAFDYTRPSRKELARAEKLAMGFKRGEEVNITDGPYAGLMGSILKMKNSNRRAVVEGSFGKVTLDVAQLDAA